MGIVTAYINFIGWQGNISVLVNECEQFYSSELVIVKIFYLGADKL